MPTSVPDALQSATAAIAAARRELGEIERHRNADLEAQIGTAETLARSKQLSADLTGVAAGALRYQRDQRSALTDAVDERRGVLDKITADLADLISGAALQ